MNSIFNRNQSKKEYIPDIVKEILQWVVVSGLSFLYWMAVLLLISLFLLNVWHVTFERLLQISIVLTVITAVGYGGVLIYRKRHG